jgi:hypothetical protein
MTQNEILLQIINDKDIQSIISKIAPKNDIDSFRQTFYEQVIHLSPKKLNDAISKNYLKYLLIKILDNQANHSSPYYKETHNLGLPKSITTYELFDSINLLCPEEYNIEEDKLYEDRLIIVDEYLKTIHWYHKTLFNLYREGNSYKEISALTEIDYQSVRLSILKTIRGLKEYIKK